MMLLIVLAPLLAFVYWYCFAKIHPVQGPIRSIEVGQFKPNESRPRRHELGKDQLLSKWNDCENIGDLLQHSIEKYGSNKALGQRKTVKVQEEIHKVKIDGKEVEKKFKIPWQTDYEWITYEQLGQKVAAFGSGLVDFGLKHGEMVGLFANTRAEWQIAAQACFAHGLPVVTIYPTLGAEALAYSLNQTHVSDVITQVSLLNSLLAVADQIPSLKRVIYMDSLSDTQLQQYQSKYPKVTFISYDDLLVEGGKKIVAPKQPPKNKDLAVIMYTSGSTGLPKGVMMSHGNILAGVAGVTYSVPEPINKDDVYIAYLPLAHVLELLAEHCLLATGGQIGYSSALTLRDDGVCDENGKPAGDLGKLRPTLMAAVPLILDRIRSGIQDQVNKAPLIQKTLFKVAYYLKHRNWMRGWKSPILDAIVFKKIKNRFGGRMRYMLSGGAPLSQATQEFIQICFCNPLLQGYGLTETLGGNVIVHPDDRAANNVGTPIPCNEVKLIDVPEMGYTSQDKNKHGQSAPRGEIAVSGANVTLGYYENEEQTKAAYQLDEDGKRWFLTGDIGRWNANGTLSIIDRKKDLVKLSHGEYIALGSLESSYAHSPFVENICVYANSLYSRPVALIVPNQKTLSDYAHANGLDAIANDRPALCKNEQIYKAVMASLQEIAVHKKYAKWEQIAAVHFCVDPWTPESGLLTEAFKLKRHEISKRFHHDIVAMYNKLGE